MWKFVYRGWVAEGDEAGVCLLRPASEAERDAGLMGDDPFGVARWLDAFLAGEEPAFMPPLHLRGTPFQQRVWWLLLEVPYGTTTTYGELARRLSEEGRRMSPQAVGQAVGRNPVALMVPCHRVVGANGSLTGYAYGLELKRWLLSLEQGLK